MLVVFAVMIGGKHVSPAVNRKKLSVWQKANDTGCPLLIKIQGAYWQFSVNQEPMQKKMGLLKSRIHLEIDMLILNLTLAG